MRLAAWISRPRSLRPRDRARPSREETLDNRNATAPGVRYAGQARTADDADPQARWAGQIVMARAREDKDTFTALIGALPGDGMAASRHLAVLLHLIATNLRPATAVSPRNRDQVKTAMPHTELRISPIWRSRWT
jgi:hypothetical protein